MMIFCQWDQDRAHKASQCFRARFELCVLRSVVGYLWSFDFAKIARVVSSEQYASAENTVRYNYGIDDTERYKRSSKHRSVQPCLKSLTMLKSIQILMIVMPLAIPGYLWCGLLFRVSWVVYGYVLVDFVEWLMVCTGSVCDWMLPFCRVTFWFSLVLVSYVLHEKQILDNLAVSLAWARWARLPLSWSKPERQVQKKL